MSADDPRAALKRLIDERGEDYSSLSRLIGRNAAYVQQYISRGVPRRLAEEDRRLLARYFGVAEELLGGPPNGGPSDGLVRVARRDVGASAGSGALGNGEAVRGRIAFEPSWLKRLGASNTDRLSIIRVEGDSMAPTLASGDEILVDEADGAERLRDGLYVLRIEDSLLVKRIALSPVPGRVAVSSDNEAYPGWPDCELRALSIVGRVIWVGRQLR